MENVKDISVVMCTWNGARYLSEQMDSILAQSYPVEEIVIQDDGTTDGTWELLETYARKSPLVRIFRNESLHGVNGNFFSAMRRARSEYIAISDQDDIWEKDKLQIQAAAIGKAAMCSGFSVPFSNDGYPVQVDMRIPNTHILRQMYLSELPGHSMLFRRELLDFLPEGEKHERFYDWQLVTVAAAQESIIFVPRTLVHFRRYANAATATLPVANKLVSGGALQYVWFSLIHHKALQKEVRARFAGIRPFLAGLPFQTVALKEACKLTELEIGQGPTIALKRIVFFVRHSCHLFHTEEKRPLIRLLRSLFFNWSCGYYYRSHLKTQIPKEQ